MIELGFLLELSRARLGIGDCSGAERVFERMIVSSAELRMVRAG
jgi:hypothetical protein